VLKDLVLLLLLGLILWLPILVGLGEILLRFLGIDECENEQSWLCWVSLRGFLGIAVAGTMALLVNFVAPVNGLVASGIWLFGAAGLVGARHGSVSRRMWILFGGLAVVVAWLSAREFRHGDTGLYHWQAVKWAASAPVVPGLANLNPWFGHNSTWWLFSAALGLPGFTAHTANLVGGTVLFFSLLLLAGCVVRVWRKEAKLGDWIIVTATYLFVRQGLGVNTPGIATSMAANLLILATAYLLATSAVELDGTSLSKALLLAAFAVTVKLQALPILVVTGSIWVLHFFKPGHSFGKSKMLITGASASLIILWMLRGIVISGYPLFPSAFLGFPSLPWSLSKAEVNSYRELVGSWHLRGLNSEAGLLQNVSQWITNQQGLQNVIFLAIAMGGFFLLLAAVLAWRWRRDRLGNQHPFLFSTRDVSLAGSGLLLAVGILGLVYCAILAPAFQYASGYFCLVAGVVLSVAFLMAEWKTWSPEPRFAVLFAILAGSFFLNGGTKAFPSVPIVHWPEFPQSPLASFVTADGLTVHFRANGFAWDAPLPASIAINPTLRAFSFGPGNLPATFFSKKPRE
jgi:hypothetical protein